MTFGVALFGLFQMLSSISLNGVTRTKFRDFSWDFFDILLLLWTWNKRCLLKKVVIKVIIRASMLGGKEACLFLC